MSFSNELCRMKRLCLGEEIIGQGVERIPLTDGAPVTFQTVSALINLNVADRWYPEKMECRSSRRRAMKWKSTARCEADATNRAFASAEQRVATLRWLRKVCKRRDSRLNKNSGL